MGLGQGTTTVAVVLAGDDDVHRQASVFGTPIAVNGTVDRAVLGFNPIKSLALDMVQF